MTLRSTSAVALLLSTCLAAPALAQLPPHHAVVGTISSPETAGPGTTGVFLVPLPTSIPGPRTPLRITGLPAALTVPVAPTSFGGAFSVLHRPSDGVLFVGDGKFFPGTINVHVLTLAGNTVSNATVVPVGVLSSNSYHGLGGLALFPDGRVLVTMGGPSQYASGPALTSALGILSTAGPAPVLTPIALRGAFAGFTWGCTVSRDASTAYVTTIGGNGVLPHRLYGVDLRTGSAYGTVTLLHTWTNHEVWRLELRPDDALHAVGFDRVATRSTLFRFDVSVRPVTVTSIALAPQDVAVTSAALDPATATMVLGSWSFPGTPGSQQFPNALVTIPKQGGALTLLAAEPVGGWGGPFSIDVNGSFERYGVDSPAAHSYAIVDCPNPDGLPERGNQQFGITVQASGGTPTSAILLGFGPASLPVPGLSVEALVQPPWITLPMTSGTLPRLALPVPNMASLYGVTLFAQGVHLDPSGLATSDAVRFTIL